MGDKRKEIPNVGDASTAFIFDKPTGRYNKTVKLAEGDTANKIKIYCKEPYAQTAYAMYNSKMEGTDIISKDLVVGEVYKGRITSYSLASNILYCEELTSKTTVIIPMNEFGDLDDLKLNPNVEFMLIKESSGTLYGSVKKYNGIKFAEDVEQFRKDGTWFEVKLIELIKGGFIALYKNTVKCFVPGAHAAANVIHDFDSMIGKKINVMVDSYDWASKLYIVSYKKYIKASLPQRIHELQFDKKYAGVLTSKPTKYGIFVEFENYFTGLIHSTEFKNYNEIMAKYRPGDPIEFYIKNIFEKNGEYRIILTLNETDIDRDKTAWTKVKRKIEGKELDYMYDESTGKFSLIDGITGEHYNLNVPFESIKDGLALKKVRVYDVNVLNQNIRFDFC